MFTFHKEKCNHICHIIINGFKNKVLDYSITRKKFEKERKIELPKLGLYSQASPPHTDRHMHYMYQNRSQTSAVSAF